MAISAYEAVKLRKQEEWKDLLEDFLDNPQSAVDHIAFGMDLDQRRQARGLKNEKSAPTWV